MLNQLRPAFVSFAALTVITGVIYPAVVTLVGKAAFPEQSTGSTLSVDDKAVGSSLIGQPFSDAKYFWSRPSACNYDASAGSGSNLGPSNPALVDTVKGRVDALLAAGGESSRPVPVDLVTASGSGLDPHISPAAAEYQIARVAAARHRKPEDVRDLVADATEPATLGCLGEKRVNVLTLNLLLDHGVTRGHAPLTLARAGGFLPSGR